MTNFDLQLILYALCRNCQGGEKNFFAKERSFREQGTEEIRHPQDTAHARIYDRLLEMCIPVSCIGGSFRKENAQEKLERLKLLIG